MKLTASDLKELGIIDEIIPEVTGGAHVDPAGQARRIADVLEHQLDELSRLNPSELVEGRYERFRHLGRFKEA